MKIDIDDLTLGQLKKINAMTNPIQKIESEDILYHLIGTKVLIRDNKAGVFITTLVNVKGCEWLGGVSRKIH